MKNHRKHVFAFVLLATLVTVGVITSGYFNSAEAARGGPPSEFEKIFKISNITVSLGPYGTQCTDIPAGQKLVITDVIVENWSYPALGGFLFIAQEDSNGDPVLAPIVFPIQEGVVDYSLNTGAPFEDLGGHGNICGRNVSDDTISFMITGKFMD